VSGTLTIYADDSLSDALNRLEAEFTRNNPGVKITLKLDETADLTQDILNGATPDLLLAAGADSVQPLIAANLAPDSPTVFATNRLTIAVPIGNPAQVASLSDLAKAGVTVAICDPTAVPCGATTQTVLQGAGVQLNGANLQPDTRAVADKVASGQANAGLADMTDVAGAANKLESIGLPSDVVAQATASYPATVLNGAADPAVAQAFKDYLLSASGQRILTNLGFGAAPIGG
jgi:molybdate transport system substrate-binding protein